MLCIVVLRVGVGNWNCIIVFIAGYFLFICSSSSRSCSSANCTGWEHWKGFGSSLLFSCTSICMGQHRRISPMSSSTPLVFGARRCPPSASSLLLTVHRTQLSTIGDQVFPVAAAHTWNSLLQHVTSTSSMSVFQGRLKAFLFRRSFPWLLLQLL